nr:RNA-directed DNA polymerase, eukaryota [Tanacetum cinerariifolium]
SVIKAIHGSSFDSHSVKFSSPWCSILRELQVLAAKCFDFVSHIKKRVGNGLTTRFWLDSWILDSPLSVRFLRMFALKGDKHVTVANKWSDSDFKLSFCREIRDGAEREQWNDMLSILDIVSLSSSNDQWICDLNGEGMFCVKDIRKIIDELYLPSLSDATRWVKHIPIKINMFAWRARLDRLPTRCNLLNRGVVMVSPLCPLCGLFPEDVQHVVFHCEIAKSTFRRICRWWDVEWSDVSSFADWNLWFTHIRLALKLKLVLEGVCYVAWWHIWSFRNQSIFNDVPPRRDTIFDDIRSLSFLWSSSRCSSSFSWDVWMKNPYLISL